jgi:hypothetical protein
VSRRLAEPITTLLAMTPKARWPTSPVTSMVRPGSPATLSANSLGLQRLLVMVLRLRIKRCIFLLISGRAHPRSIMDIRVPLSSLRRSDSIRTILTHCYSRNDSEMLWVSDLSDGVCPKYLSSPQRKSVGDARPKKGAIGIIKG